MRPWRRPSCRSQPAIPGPARACDPSYLRIDVGPPDHPAFRAGDLHTGFIDAHLDELRDDAPPPATAIAAAAMFDETPAATETTGGPPARSAADPWTTLGQWGR